ncbi:choice-of-anchor G family protein [Leucobacter massiliensis]|nr:choice-of-anchor G family protein [Leucobacter massiliensis]
MKSEGSGRPRRRGLRVLGMGAATATVAAAGLVTMPFAASADEAAPGEDVVSAAHGHGLWSELLGLELAGTARTDTAYPDSPGPISDELDVSLLGAAVVEVGSVQLPLIKEPGDPDAAGLLELGSLGTLSSYAESTSETRSRASSGLLTEEGALAVDAAAEPGFEPARIDVTGLLTQLIGADATEQLLDQAAIEVGALGSEVVKENSTVTSEYMLSDIRLDASSPLVGGLTGTVDGVVGALLQPIQDLLGPDGTVGSAVSDVVDGIGALPLVDAELNELSIDTASLTDEVRAALLQTPLENAEGSVSVNLADGTIGVDLGALLIDSQDGATLNTLAPNTEVLDDAIVNGILDGVSDALIGNGPNSLVSKAAGIVTNGIRDVEVVVDIQADISLPVVGPLVDAPVTVSGTVGEFLDGSSDLVDVSGINVAGIPVGTVLDPITSLLSGLVGTIGGALQPLVDTVVAQVQPNLIATVSPLVTNLLDNALEPVLNEIVEIRINEQPTEAPLARAAGDLGAGSFTTRALSVSVLPFGDGGSAIPVQLGSATVLAEDLAAGLTVTPNPVEQGGTVTIDGTGFAPGETVTVTLPDGSETPVIADEEGAITLTWDVPETQTPGTVDFSAVGEDSGSTAEGSTVVQLAPAALTATPDPVERGGTVTLTGAGFAPGETVTVTFPDGTTAPATADEDGGFVTEWTVPADFDADDAAFTALGDDSGRTGTDTVAVAAAGDDDANVNASASASASADADDASNASAQVAAQAAALADATSSASAAADVSADAAAEVAATADASAEASAESNAAASAAATASADSTADSAQDADTTAAAQAAANADASSAAQAAAAVAADADASATASADAAAAVEADATADADASAEVNANASASASASADADDNSNASAQVAAQAAALADATSSASAAADVSADAAAEAAATPDASAEASAESNAAAAAAATASADSTADSAQDADSTAAAQAAANADASSAAQAAAAVAADASASATASATASAAVAADATAAATADSTASAASTASASGAANAAQASAQGSASASGAKLPQTGSAVPAGFAIGGALLLLAGAGALLLARRRSGSGGVSREG